MQRKFDFELIHLDLEIKRILRQLKKLKIYEESRMAKEEQSDQNLEWLKRNKVIILSHGICSSVL